jgi:D-3-phosphoglycerate dehydrogenase / 2-oxoglutarate reductase
VDVNGKTLGIIGLGAIGRNVARRARGFDMRVLAYDVFQNAEFAAAHQVEYTDLDTIFRTADFITLHAPATPETRGMVTAARLKSMKPSAYLINTARGDLIDMDALHTALKENWIAGAALDVFPKEPPTGTPLADLDNVILSPHVAGMSVEANRAAAKMACESVVRVLAGEKALYAVNTEVYGR